MLDHLAVAEPRDVDFGDGDAASGRLHPGKFSAMRSGDDRAVRNQVSLRDNVLQLDPHIGKCFGVGGEESLEARQVGRVGRERPMIDVVGARTTGR